MGGSCGSIMTLEKNNFFNVLIWSILDLILDVIFVFLSEYMFLPEKRKKRIGSKNCPDAHVCSTSCG